ncbi:MAG: glycoside hydrolase family 25 protein [Bacteroidia bacterium]|nr:glycoside hydrolase family 25 protein [Bacteroidia bacterium]
MKTNRPLQAIRNFLLFMLISGSFIFFLAKCGKRAFRYAERFYQERREVARNYNLPGFGIAMPTQYLVHGIDISHYQDVIDWSAVADMNVQGIKIDFVFIKATEGRESQDPHFAYNWRESRRQSLLRGAYHFYRPNVNSNYQAENFIQTVSMESGDLPPILDIEITGKYSMDNTRAGLQNWLNIIEAHYGVRPIIYTNLHYYQDHLKGYFDDYPLWIAQYGRDDLNLDKKAWLFWQHSDRGLMNGVAGFVNFDVFNGSLQSLKALSKP